MPLAFVPNQPRLRLNNAEVRMLSVRRKREGGAVGNANDSCGKPNDLGSHLNGNGNGKGIYKNVTNIATLFSTYLGNGPLSFSF
jgi:hypothetical protein